MAEQKKVAVIGGSGQIGYGLSKALLKLNHEVVAVSRKRGVTNEAKLTELERLGAVVKECGDYADIDSLTGILKGCDTVVVAMRANAKMIRQVEPRILEAAVNAGAKRFVPDEFGCHTLLIDYGDGTLFDAKKDLHQKIFKSGMDWTFIYNGVIFDYMVPNFRMWDKITTFGDVNIELTTHDLGDIVTIAAMAVTDDRTVNKAVQISANKVTQAGMIEKLQKNWPDRITDIDHISSEEIIDKKVNSDPDKISAKGGFEPDQERYGINYVVYVIGKLFGENRSDTLLAQELYPDYKFKTPEEAMKDVAFVFGEQP